MRHVVLALALGCSGGEAPEDTGPLAPEAPHWSVSDSFLPIAHRFGANLGPENTLAALDQARAVGARVVEVDVVQTSDGHLVLLHDSTVDRTTDGTGLITQLTLAEAQALDAGYTFTRDGGATYPFRGQGVQIPTFEEALAAGADLYWDVEIKQTDPPIYHEVIAAIEAAGMKDRVFIACFDDATIKAVRKDYPDYVTNFGPDEYGRLAALSEAQEDGYDPPGEIAQIPVWYLSPEFVERAHRHGVRVHVWTINDTATMAHALDLGVDGIITDEPGLLLQLLDERGITPF